MVFPSSFDSMQSHAAIGDVLAKARNLRFNHTLCTKSTKPKAHEKIRIDAGANITRIECLRDQTPIL